MDVSGCPRLPPKDAVRGRKWLIESLWRLQNARTPNNTGQQQLLLTARHVLSIVSALRRSFSVTITVNVSKYKTFEILVFPKVNIKGCFRNTDSFWCDKQFLHTNSHKMVTKNVCLHVLVINAGFKNIYLCTQLTFINGSIFSPLSLLFFLSLKKKVIIKNIYYVCLWEQKTG